MGALEGGLVSSLVVRAGDGVCCAVVGGFAVIKPNQNKKRNEIVNNLN